MKKSKDAPTVPKDLLDYLEKQFPDKLPETAISLDEIRISQGTVKVVRHLRWLFSKQNETILNG